MRTLWGWDKNIMEDGKQFCLQFLLCEGKVQRNLNEEQLVVGCHQDSPSVRGGQLILGKTSHHVGI